jgi:hypothetical protein
MAALDWSQCPAVESVPGDVFDRHVRIDAVLIEEVDPIRLESSQRGVGDFAIMCRSAVQSDLLAVLELEAEFRRNHHSIANRSERFADELFVRERPVRLGGVERPTLWVNLTDSKKPRVVEHHQRENAG